MLNSDELILTTVLSLILKSSNKTNTITFKDIIVTRNK